ncbi:unnamed protein product [Oikopleura dioica]|uniref:Uncharacterized protein n=1 Tax=Oikopleura dioica TaxID=34765 RepID=E4WS26_OIKDI|nr:unnamed protein product [Oikopleura dioica]
MTTSDGLWDQLGASPLIESCGPEIAEVLHQVDRMVEAKRSEWEAQYAKAVQNEQAAKIKIQNQQLEYENRIKQLRVDMGALKDAYMKLEKHHNSRPDKYRRIVHAKNKEIADLHGKNDRLLEEITVLKDDKQRLKEQLKKNEEKFTEERTKNIILEGEIIKNKEMSIERDIVNENMRKLKVKYENLKRALKDIEKENTPPREEAPIATITTTVPKLKLPLPNESSVTPATSEAGTPRSTASNSSVYVVPIPVFDIDENEVNSELPAYSPRAESRLNQITRKYQSEDDEFDAIFNAKIDGHIAEFTDFVNSIA